MDWSRLASSLFGSLFVAFLLGAMVSPPDPFTQLLFVIPAVVALVPLAYRYHPRIRNRDRVHHALFLVAPFTAQLVWRYAVPGAPEFSVAHVALVVAGTALGGWLAYLGGLEYLRGNGGVSEA